MMAIEILKPKILVVEGREDESFFGAFIKHLALENIQIIPIGGKEQLRSNLKALTLSPHFHEVLFLCVVRDANSEFKTGGGKKIG